MGKRRKRSEKKAEGPSPRASRTESDGREASSGAKLEPGRIRRRSWWEANRSDLRFLLIFALCLGLFYVCTLVPPVKYGFFPAYLRLNAQVSGVILPILGEEVTVRNQSIISAGGPSIDIERGCDAVAPSALFVSAVLASPVPLLSRLLAATLGTIVLMLLNLVRVVSLLLVRVHYPRAFETMHLDVWQAVFIILAIVLWAVWASQMARKRTGKTNVAT